MENNFNNNLNHNFGGNFNNNLNNLNNLQNPGFSQLDVEETRETVESKF